MVQQEVDKPTRNSALAPGNAWAHPFFENRNTQNSKNNFKDTYTLTHTHTYIYISHTHIYILPATPYTDRYTFKNAQINRKENAHIYIYIHIYVYIYK